MIYETGYIRLYRGALQGTAAALDNATWGFFTRLLLMADKEGVIKVTEHVGYTPELLAKITSDSVRAIKRYLDILNSPDALNPYQECDGRRIEIDDKGIITIINYAKYQTGWERKAADEIITKKPAAGKPIKPKSNPPPKNGYPKPILDIVGNAYWALHKQKYGYDPAYNHSASNKRIAILLDNWGGKASTEAAESAARRIALALTFGFCGSNWIRENKDATVADSLGSFLSIATEKQIPRLYSWLIEAGWEAEASKILDGFAAEVQNEQLQT